MSDKGTNYIVHIATDEKFINAAYDIYEKAFPGNNKFFILKEESDEIIYLNRTYDYFILNTTAGFIDSIIEYCFGARVVVFHGMNEFQAKVALEINIPKLKYVWSPFGIEVNNNNAIVKNLPIGPITYKKFVYSFGGYFKEILRPIYYLVVKGKKDPYKGVRMALQSMDFVSGLDKEEFLKYHEYGIVKPTVKHFRFSYYPIDYVKNYIEYTTKENHILLGNSATLTNNHLELFKILEDLDLRNFKIFAPLSYGNKIYADYIIDVGAKMFGQRFNPIIKFIPFEEYQRFLSSCAIVIMNHYRTQAAGNVLTSLYLGSKVYLSEKSTLYQYLKRIGCIVFSVERDLVAENCEVLSLLTITERAHNKSIIAKELSLDDLVRDLQESLMPVLSMGAPLN